MSQIIILTFRSYVKAIIKVKSGGGLCGYYFMSNNDKLSKTIEFTTENFKIYNELASWKILIVDDEEDVHRITRLAMLGIEYDNMPIEFISAYSGEEACEIMRKTEDIALVILDVVMENEHSGLDVANYIRNELNNHLVRIVLRTGQPGQVPEDQILELYDINDYKEKPAVTTQKLRLMIRSNLHAFNDKRELCSATTKILQLNRLSQRLVSFTDLKAAARFIYENLYFYLNKERPQKRDFKGHIFSFINPMGDMCEFHDYYTGERVRQEDLPSEIIAETAVNRKATYRDQEVTTLAYSDYHGVVFYLNLAENTGYSYNEDLANLLQDTISNHYRNIYLNALLNRNQREIMYRICEIVESRSKESGIHVKRVSQYCELLAKLAGVPQRDINLLKQAAPLHDLGKIAIPDDILHKPGKLDNYEWEVMRTHSQIGYELLKDSNIELFNVAAEVAFYHHEKWNGTGYPNGLSGEDIPLNGRIAAIADVFDALASERCYKHKWPMDKIYELFKEERGQHFDPKLTDLFIQNFDKFVAIKEKIDGHVQN